MYDKVIPYEYNTRYDIFTDQWIVMVCLKINKTCVKVGIFLSSSEIKTITFYTFLEVLNSRNAMQSKWGTLWLASLKYTISILYNR